MEPDKNSTPTSETPASNEASTDGVQAPADALSRTPDDLESEQAASGSPTPNPTEKPVSPIKKLLKRINIYLLMFILIVVIAGVISAVMYLNSTKTPDAPDIKSQQLTTEALKQLANTDASVGNSSQTLTIQGNTVIAGQTLMRGNLNVAGNLQTGGTIQAPGITISGSANLGDTQINSLQVATNFAVQGTTTVRDLNVSGTSSFSGPMTASQITTSKLILSGNATLQIPNHISFTGPSPNRSSINNAVLGSGGTASINGSDTTGTINISTGGGPTAGCFLQLAFAQAFTNEPHVLVSPIGQAAGQLEFYVTRSKTGFSLCTANAAAANQAFAFDYFVTN